MSFLTDINNVNVDGFYIGANGIVYGQIGGTITDSLSSESCNIVNMNLIDNVCYWKTNISGFNNIDMALNQQQSVSLNYNEGCTYTLELDYLLYLDSNELDNSKIGTNLENLEYFATFNKNGTHSYIKILDERTLLEQFTDNNDSGVFVDGSFANVKTFLSTYLNTTIQNAKFSSNWVSVKIPLTQTDINNINNSIFGLVLNKPFEGFEFKIDNIKINEECEDIITKTKIYNVNPSFDFDRLIDNKKSWSTDDLNRDYTTVKRDTKYNVSDDREILNSKELDLNISYHNTVETMFYEMIKENPLYITNFILSNPIFDEFDINSSELDTLSEFLIYFIGQFCNPRSYRTSHKNVISYYLTNLVNNSSTLTFDNITPIIEKIDKYWLDIISQFVPSTSIWESNIVLGNTNFNYEKFRYRKYSLVDLSPYSIGQNIKVDSDLDGNVVYGVDKTLINFSLGSEFVGTFEYDELPKPQQLLYYNNGYVGENDMCGNSPSPLLSGFMYNLSVGSIMFTDEDGTINFSPSNPDLFYFVLFAGIPYSVNFSADGVIQSLENLTNCVPNPEMVQLYNTTYENPLLACSSELGEYTVTYTKEFYLSFQLYYDTELNNLVNVPNSGRYYTAIYNGVRYVIRLDINGVIVEMDECSDAVIPQPPQSFNVSGGQFLLTGSIYGNDQTVNQYEIQYSLNGFSNFSTIFVTKTGSTTPWTENNVQAGLYSVRCRSLNSQGLNSTWITVNNVTVTGVSEIVIREPETTDPCETFPPIKGIDRSAFMPIKNLELIKSGIPLYTNAQLTDRFIPTNQNGRVLIGDLAGDKLIDTNISVIGEVVTLNPCSIRPMPIDVVLTPSPIADNGCIEFVGSDKIRVWNNNGFKIGSRFFTDEALSEQLNLSSFEGQYLVGKIDTETVPRSMLISNGSIAQLAVPCSSSGGTKLIKINPNSIDISPKNSCNIGGQELESFNNNLYYEGTFNKGTILYHNISLSDRFIIDQIASISFINEGSSTINNLRISNGEVLDFYPCGRLNNLNDVVINQNPFQSIELACVSNNFNQSKVLYTTEIGNGVKLYEDIDLTIQFEGNGVFSSMINRIKSTITLENGTIINYKQC